MPLPKQARKKQKNWLMGYVYRQGMPSYCFQRGESLCERIGKATVLPPPAQGAATKIDQHVGQERVIVRRDETRPRKTQPAKPWRRKERRGKAYDGRSQSDGAPRHVEANQEAQAECACRHGSAWFAIQSLQRPLHERAGGHAVDNPKVYRRVDRGEARRNKDADGQCAVSHGTP